MFCLSIVGAPTNECESRLQSKNATQKIFTTKSNHSPLIVPAPTALIPVIVATATIIIASTIVAASITIAVTTLTSTVAITAPALVTTTTTRGCHFVKPSWNSLFTILHLRAQLAHKPCALSGADESNAIPTTACAASTPNTMRVIFNRLWKVIINHPINFG